MRRSGRSRLLAPLMHYSTLTALSDQSGGRAPETSKAVGILGVLRTMAARLRAARQFPLRRKPILPVMANHRVPVGS